MRKLLTVTLFSGILTLVRMASGVLIAKVVAIYTGPSGMAMLGQVQSLVAAMSGIAASPGGNGLVRYTAEYRDRGFDACAPWWSASLKWGLGLLVPIALLAALAAEPISELLFDRKDYAWLVLLISLGLPLSMANTFVASVLNGQENYRRYIGLGLISVICATAAMLILIDQTGLNGALAAAALSSTIAGALMLAGSWRLPWFRLKYWWGRGGASQFKGVGGYVAMAITTAITAPLALMAVRKILVDQVGWEQTGHWQAVYRISEVYLGVITIALSTYFLPKLSSLSGYETIKNEITTTAKVVMPLVAAMALCVYLLRDFTITLLFTEDFRPARKLFAVQLAGDVIKIFSWLYAYPMLSSGATKWFTTTEIFFSLNLVILTYIIVGVYGVEGAVVASALNYCIYLGVVYTNLHRFVR